MRANKQAIRIMVDIPEGDDRLVTWRSLTEKHGMDKRMYRQYDAAGGFGARNWWIFVGVIPPAWFSAVDFYPVDEAEYPFERSILAEAEKYPTFDELMVAIGLTTGPSGATFLDLDRLKGIAAITD
jgi:hypothetical protein